MKKLFPIIIAIIIFISSSTVTVNAAKDDSQVINDIKNWKHPVKAVFSYNRIQLNKVVLLKSKTYPVFYTSLPNSPDSNSKVYFNRVLKEIARANGYWDYSLMDEARKVAIDVYCNKDTRRIDIIVLNNKDYYFNELFNTKASTGQKNSAAFIYLEKQVPEIEEYCKSVDAYNMLHSKENGYEVHVIFRLDNTPNPKSTDKYLRDYYHIYIGEDHDDHTSRWQTFLVRNDLKEILVDNAVSSSYLSLDEWRRLKADNRK